MNFKIRNYSNIQKMARARQSYIILSNETKKNFVIFNLISDRDFLFEPNLLLCHNLDDDGNVFAHIVDLNMTEYCSEIFQI